MRGLLLPALLILTSCSSAPRALLVRPLEEAGADAADAAEGAPDAGLDADPTLGGPCTDDAQCDDHIPCTYDSCDKSLLRCRNVPDDTQCDDGVYCDGKERCVLLHGCEPGPVVTCDDGNPCTINHCVEATKSCAHDPRDVDGDGDPDDHCVPHHDCNDLDPTVASTHSEVCQNHKDDNCNGLVDEQPCVVPQGDTCPNAVAVGAPGTYAVSTVGADRNFATSCSVTQPSGARTLVVAVTVPPGPHVDIDVWATTATGEVALAMDASCGQPSTELACAFAPGATVMRLRARNQAPGTYALVVTTQMESSVELAIDYLSPTPRATNESCSNAAPITPDTPTTVSIIDPAKDLPSACAATTGELTYALTLGATSDVRVFASILKGSGQPVLGLRDPACAGAADELRCNEGPVPPLFARGLPPGTYVITVAATSPVDESILVKTYPPTTPPADESCASPPAAVENGTLAVDLSNNEAAIQDGCLPGSPSAAFDLPLAVASDVLLVGRMPENETGAVSLDDLTCTAAGRLACGTGSTPARVGKRNVPAGDYRAVLADALGEQDSLMALVRPTVPPTIVSSADVCATALTIPPEGGFFTGDTSTANADYSDSCDSASSPPFGAPDQVLTLTLAQPERVVFDMEGSVYRTILDVHQGPSCPGPEVSGACYVGFTPARSFLDLELAAGQYWVVIDGYAGEKGSWNLDVRVLPP